MKIETKSLKEGIAKALRGYYQGVPKRKHISIPEVVETLNQYVVFVTLNDLEGNKVEKVKSFIETWAITNNIDLIDMNFYKTDAIEEVEIFAAKEKQYKEPVIEPTELEVPQEWSALV